MEIFLAPSFPMYYQFIINAQGSIWDSIGKDPSWNGTWLHAVRVRDGRWEGEIAVPFSSLGATPQEGVSWRFNLCRDYPPKKEALTFAPSKFSLHEPQNFAFLSFGEHSQGLRLFLPLENLSLPPDVNEAGSIWVEVEGLGDCKVKVGIKGQEDREEEVSVGKGERKRIGSTHLASGSEARISILALNPQGKEMLSMEGYLKREPLLKVEVIRRFLTKGSIDLLVTSEVLGERIKGVRAYLERNRREIVKKEWRFEKGKVEGSMRVAHLPAGNYKLRVEALDEKGDVLDTYEETLTLPGRPTWLHSQAGITDEVLPPWTPIEVKGDEVKVWGRSYTFGEEGLPKSIRSKGEELLAGPVYWEIESEGDLQTKGMKRVWEAKPSLYVAVWENPDYTCKASAEFDGMIRFDVALHPQREITIKRLALVIPLKSAYAKYLHYFPGMWGSCSNSFGLKGDWESAFRPLVFIADEEKGLSWFCESDEKFRLADPQRAIEVRRKGEETVLRINIINVPTKIKSFSLTFGLQATPVRPVPVAWWLKDRICHWGYYGLEKAPAPIGGPITYPAEGNIDPERGSLQAWVRIDFDAQEPVAEGIPRGNYNRDFWAIHLPNGDTASLYWNIDDRGMRFFAYHASTDEYPLILGAPSNLPKGWHNIALSWGDEIRIFVDGVLTARHPFRGLFGKEVDLKGARMVLGGGRCEMAIEQFAIYNQSLREIFPTRPLPQENALLWDYLGDVEEMKTKPRIGVGGVLSAPLDLVESPGGKALLLWRPDWRERKFLDVAQERGVRTIIFHEHWTDIQNYTETTHEEEMRSLVDALHRRGMRLGVYFGYEMADIAPEFPFYSQECLAWRPGQWFYTRLPQQKDYRVCYNSPWADFLADGMEKVLKEYDIDGVYLDGTASPMSCDNRLHGCGYLDEKGNLHPTYPIFAVRNLMKRIYTICYKHRPDWPLVNVHNSTYLGPPTLAFATSYWDGEQFAGVPRDGKHPLEILPLDAFRCEFMGHNIGVPADFLVYEGNPFTYQEGLAIALLHDVFPRPPGMGSEGFEIASRIWKAFEEFGAMESEWIPYWRSGDLVGIDKAEVYASVYLKKGKGALVVISNLGRKEEEVNLTLNAKRLGFSPKKVREIVTGLEVSMGKDKIRLPLPAFRLRVLFLKDNI